MIRSRVHLRSVGVVRVMLALLVSLLAAALVFYGAIVVLAALKLAPHTLDSISAYRTVYDDLSGITARAISGRDRIIVAVAGVLGVLVFAPVTWRSLPRPYLARTVVELQPAPEHGRTEVAPRAIERTAEIAACGHDAVSDAAARAVDGTLDVHVDLDDTDDLLGTLRAVQQLVRDALHEHGLPDGPVDVTLAGVLS